MMLFYRCGLCVTEMSVYCQKPHLNVFHKNCFIRLFYSLSIMMFVFYAIAINKMTLIWVRFHLVVIKPFEVSVLTKHDSKRN